MPAWLAMMSAQTVVASLPTVRAGVSQGLGHSQDSTAPDSLSVRVQMGVGGIACVSPTSVHSPHSAVTVPTLQAASAAVSQKLVSWIRCRIQAGRATTCLGSTLRPPTPSSTSTPLMDVAGSASADHGHVAVISGSQLMAGSAVALDIRGSADHPHTVQLSATEVMAIAQNQSVSKQSSVDVSHQHTVTFN